VKSWHIPGVLTNKPDIFLKPGWSSSQRHRALNT
jgi:hypothetical protein